MTNKELEEKLKLELELVAFNQQLNSEDKCKINDAFYSWVITDRPKTQMAKVRMYHKITREYLTVKSNSSIK